MPRLVGKTSYSGLYSTLAIVALALGAATALEYFGFIDVVPSFGTGKVIIQENRSQRSIPQSGGYSNAPTDARPLVERR